MFSRLIARLSAKLLQDPRPALPPASSHAVPPAVPVEVAVAPKPGYPSYHDMVQNTLADVLCCDSNDQLVAYLGDRSGYVREAAVDRVSALGKSELLLALAPRLNDWVRPVRDKARHAVLTLVAALTPVSDEHIAMRLLLEVQRLQRTRRWDHADWIAEFERLLIDVLGAERIVAAIAGVNNRVGRACFALARKYGLADVTVLCRLALTARGDGVLSRNALELAQSLEPGARLDVYRQALHASLGIARAEALRNLLQANDPDSIALCESMLTDSNTWVRMVASAFLVRSGINVPARYSERIAAAGSDWRTVRACLYGLAESGSKAHSDLVRTYVAHDQARVQIAALLAWAHLSPQDKDDIALHALRSEHKRVRRLVTVLARKFNAYIPVDVGLSILREHGNIEAMFALVQGDPWAMLEVVATVADDVSTTADFRHRLAEQLCAWLDSATRAYARPTPRQREFLSREAVRQTLLDSLAHSPSRQRQLAQELSAL